VTQAATTPRHTGSRAIVTGAASGIGAACMAQLRAEGAEVVGFDTQPGEGITVVDVAEEAAVMRAVVEAERQLGGAPTVLVCAAGIYPCVPLLEMTGAAWHQTFAVNVCGSMFCAREAVIAAKRAGTGLTIVLFSSVGAYRSDWSEPSAAYCATKAAITSLARSMAGEWAPFGVRVNALAPGLIDTPMLKRTADSEAGAAAIRDRIPLGRLGAGEDVARVACFLASDEAAYVTGTTVTVDGGYLVR
jgi:NAD(P)-dependent dehydrogenase (short-subunit alcohol dehydrogenase family)